MHRRSCRRPLAQPVRAAPAFFGPLPRAPRLVSALVAILAAGLLPAAAATPPDLRPYPPAGPNERRWFIAVEAPAGAAAEQRVELIVGRMMTVDCNRHLLRGSLEEETVPGWGFPMFRVKGGRQVVSTRMACPGQRPRREFVALGGEPSLVLVNPRLPIVVVAPSELEVRWRLWRAEPAVNPARTF